MTRLRRPRYARIVEASAYVQANTRLADWLRGRIGQDPRTGPGTNRPPTQQIFLKPHGLEMAATQWARARIGVGVLADVQTMVTPYVDETLAASATAFRLDRFRPSKIIVTQNIAENGTATPSRVTGLSYLKYGGTSFSFPFGGDKTATDPATAPTEAEIASDLIDQCRTKYGTSSATRVSHRPQVLNWS